MTIFSMLEKRRAVRNYEDRPVEKEKIIQLLEAATWAPNDRLREPWSFYIFQGEGKKKYQQIAEDFLFERFPDKEKLRESSLKVVKNTPLIIVVTSDIIEDDPAASEDNEYAVCCAIHSMWLAAEELGLGFVWRTRGVGLVRDERLFSLIDSPENKKIIGSLFIGYPDEKALENMKEKKRTDYLEKTTWCQ
ncbi:nitroreductase [Oikeobacillus pervagus]|uniref:Nitroreductase n=1 Tax=Oikeobacillus pervagus TaxID=1325931 RepID=A0AAJ1SWN0_9BACI|nr:nitroreductase [Oikeobacillus pervagus]MDQ0214223.1 nitroreductase [Oikeobacillus pervagus]